MLKTSIKKSICAVVIAFIIIPVLFTLRVSAEETSFIFLAKDAAIINKSEATSSFVDSDPPYIIQTKNIAIAEWDIHVETEGRYRVIVHTSGINNQGSYLFVIATSSEIWEFKQNENLYGDFKTRELGEIVLRKSDKTIASRIHGDMMVKLASLSLILVEPISIPAPNISTKPFYDVAWLGMDSLNDPYANPPNLFWEIIVFINARWWLALILVLIIGAAWFTVYKLYNGHLEKKYGFRIINKPGLVAIGVSCVYAILPFVFGFLPFLSGLHEKMGWFSLLVVDISFEAMVLRGWVLASPFLLIYLINTLVKTKSVIHAIFATLVLAALIPVFMYLAQFIVGFIIAVFLMIMIVNWAVKTNSGTSGGRWRCPKCGKILASEHTSCC